LLMQAILITGINGLAGAHLAGYVRNHHPDIEIWGSIRSTGNLRLLKFILGEELEGLRLCEADFTDKDAIKTIVAGKAFEKIFHFAARVPISLSIKNPEQTFQVNLMGTLYLLEEIRRYLPDSIVVLPGSSDEYGLIRAEDNPVGEDCPLRPLNPYGVSKAAQSLLGWQYHKSYNLRIIRTRTFSYTGPGQDPLFACSSFARQLSRIEAGKAEPIIRVGNLEAFRDYTDIRDIVRAYWMLAEKGVIGEVYNICSGESVCMREILDRLIDLCSKKVQVQPDLKRMRPSDIPEVCGDNSRISSCTGWKPEISLDRMLHDIYFFWRENAD
jgi:GDP-4-dehydro-6-deoxy-D-mannose reductase